MKDEILLKIHRQFSKDESVNYMLSFITLLRTEKGILQSEISEHLDTIKQKELEISNIKNQVIGMQKALNKTKMNERELMLNKKVSELRKEIRKLVNNQVKIKIKV